MYYQNSFRLTIILPIFLSWKCHLLIMSPVYIHLHSRQLHITNHYGTLISLFWVQDYYNVFLSYQSISADSMWKSEMSTMFELSSSIRYKMACVHSKDSNQPAHPHSLISLSFPPDEMISLWLPIEHSSKTDQPAQLCSLICVLDGHKCQFVSFQRSR